MGGERDRSICKQIPEVRTQKANSSSIEPTLWLYASIGKKRIVFLSGTLWFNNALCVADCRKVLSMGSVFLGGKMKREWEIRAKEMGIERARGEGRKGKLSLWNVRTSRFSSFEGDKLEPNFPRRNSRETSEKYGRPIELGVTFRGENVKIGWCLVFQFENGRKRELEPEWMRRQPLNFHF